MVSSTGCVAVPQSGQCHRVMMVRAEDARMSLYLLHAWDPAGCYGCVAAFCCFQKLQAVLSVLSSTSAENWPSPSCTAQCACHCQSSFMLSITVLRSHLLYWATAPFFCVLSLPSSVSPLCNYCSIHRPSEPCSHFINNCNHLFVCVCVPLPSVCRWQVLGLLTSSWPP